MRTRSMVLAVIAAVVLIAVLYIAALSSNAKPADTIKQGSFAEYTFNVQPSGTNGTYRWEVLSVSDNEATVMEQISVNSTVSNYTSYLDLETGAMHRERVTVNGTLQEPLCFMMVAEEKIPQCPYYSPLRVEGSASAFGRNGVKIVPESSASEYMIFDKKIGIVLEARYGTEQIWSTYKLMTTNIF